MIKILNEFGIKYMRTFKIIFLLISVSCAGCTKNDNGISKFSAGTYYGEKTIQNFSTNNYACDTITIKFDGVKYLYSGSWELDYGKGNYFISNDSVEFNDELIRNTMHSWNWILSEKYKFRLIDDSLILSQRHYNQLITCRLTRIAKH
jgi:major membrane immunogen (membrane-anchored lipoprotein)